ncbi:MAG: pseudaminic acid synthase [Acidimicrobiales bacterium]|nr:pseudaminic acid synthase [Acidimicrobiales bacterium]MCB1014243.1 pseudaminic acid synthase [Acidimicrobiales bacterium]MCB9372579.1 pseudaminic acid synthase [Microthrixaceae bacterium]
MSVLPRTVALGERRVGPGEPVYVIAELSANHGHDLDTARAIVAAAAEAGADAVKLQTYTADTMTIDARTPPFVVGDGTLWAGRNLYELYQEAATPWEWHAELQAQARDLGLDLFSTPFDATAVAFLDELGTPAMKIASFELVDLELIRAAAATGQPLIVSTGMATDAEIDEAVEAAVGAGATGLVLLRCNSSYPAPPDEMDLRTIPAMARRWSVPVGFSDHTLGTTAATVAVALGASVLEKHLTLRRSDGGPDAAFSLEPGEFGAMVAAVREAEAALGGVRFGPSERERASLAFRRSLFVVADVGEGEVLTRDHVAAIRPGDGLAPKHLDAVLGRVAARPLVRGTPLDWDLLVPEGLDRGD